MILLEIWLKEIRIGSSNRSFKQESPLAAHSLKLLSVIPGWKAGLSHIVVKTDINVDLPSRRLTVLHALIVLIMIGLSKHF